LLRNGTDGSAPDWARLLVHVSEQGLAGPSEEAWTWSPRLFSFLWETAMGLPEIRKAGYVRNSFSGHFRSWRSQNGKPLKAVAQELGVGVTTVSQWELGRRFPTAENLEAIAQHTGIPPAASFVPARKPARGLPA